MLDEPPIAKMKRTLAEPQHAQRMQRLLNAKHELRNAKISSFLFFVTATASIGLQVLRYADKGQVQGLSVLFVGVLVITFVISLARLRRARISYAAERNGAAA